MAEMYFVIMITQIQTCKVRWGTPFFERKSYTYIIDIHCIDDVVDCPNQLTVVVFQINVKKDTVGKSAY